MVNFPLVCCPLARSHDVDTKSGWLRWWTLNKLTSYPGLRLLVCVPLEPTRILDSVEQDPQKETRDANKIHLGENCPFVRTKKKFHLIGRRQNYSVIIPLNLLRLDVHQAATKVQHQHSSGCGMRIYGQTPLRQTIV